MPRVIFLILISLTMYAVPTFAQEKAPPGWETAAPREEIKPQFSFKDGTFIITADKREGLHGWWHKSFPIEGGKFYQFHAARKCNGIEVPRRSAVVRILWQNDKGKYVTVDPPDPPNPSPAKGDC